MALRRRARVIVPVVLVLLGSLLLAPATALADGRGHRGFGGRHFGGNHVGQRHFVGHRHFAGAHGKFVFGGSDFFSDRFNGVGPGFGRCCFKKSFVHQPFFYTPVVPYAVDASPAVVYAPPSIVYSPTVIAAAPVEAPAPVAYAPVVPAPEPMPRVVEHPTGRYELRGDGVATSYTWVWIPNPPPGPPAPEAVAPAQAPSGERPPARRTQVYRWTDAEGVEHWTDRRPDVPEEPRPPAQRPNT